MNNNDSLQFIINNFRLPIIRNDKNIGRYLDDQYKIYIDALKNLINYKPEYIKDSFIENFRTHLNLIQKNCDSILNVIKVYEEGYVSEAIKEFENSVNEISKYLLMRNIDQSNGIHEKYYRMRVSEEDKNYKRENLFHIPLDEKEFINNYRYSIAGYPCLYLATQPVLCWMECEMPKRFSMSEFLVNQELQNKPLVIDFYSDIKNVIWKLKYDNSNAAYEQLLLNHLTTYPLKIACSLTVLNRRSAHRPEYLIPQLLLLWVRKSKDLDGIIYKSSVPYKEALKLDAFNLVMPAKEIVNNKYCAYLANIFKISQPMYITVSNEVKKALSSCDVIREFTERLEYINTCGISTPIYRDLLSLCSSFLNTFESLIAETYSDSSAILGNIESLNLYANMINKYKGNIISTAIAEEIHPEYKKDIELNLANILEEFDYKIRPILGELWNYSSKLFYSTNHEEESYMHITISTQ